MSRRPRRVRRWGAVGVLALTGLLVTACGGSGGGTAGTSGRTPATLTVLAAASLKEAFTTLGHDFETAHPGVHVQLSFAGSPTLVQQVIQGAPSDVLATADQRTMTQLTDAGQGAAAPQLFATNELEIAVPHGNPAHVTGLADLTRPGLRLALCAPQVPCGAVARRALAAAHLSATPVTIEPDVKSVLTKVDLGEVDAGVVYRTDVRSDPRVDGVVIPASQSARTSYPIVVLRDSAHPDLAREFVALVTSAQGRRVLAAAGFGSP